MYCPLLGFRHQRFSAQALLHGHLQPTCFLPPAANAPHVWLSTGSRDTLVPPHVLHEAAERVQVCVGGCCACGASPPTNGLVNDRKNTVVKATSREWGARQSSSAPQRP